MRVKKNGMVVLFDWMSRQLGEAMLDSLGIRVEDTFTVGIDLEKALANREVQRISYFVKET